MRIIQWYSENLRYFGYLGIPKYHQPKSFNERMDPFFVMLVKECPKIETFVIREKVSTSTVLLVAEQCKSLKKYYVRRNAVILKCDWPCNPIWEDDYFNWLKKSSRSYEETENEVSRILGFRWKMLSDKEFVGLSPPLYTLAIGIEKRQSCPTDPPTSTPRFTSVPRLTSTKVPKRPLNAKLNIWNGRTGLSAMSSIDDFLGSLLTVAAKAGRIAKACREDEHLLSLLVQEKKESEKNPRFLHDFKTLADVLVQEVIKYHVSSKFPELKGHIYGEETNEFSNGESSIIVEVKETEIETTALLNQVLDDEQAANALAKVIHNDEDFEEVANNLSISQLPEELGIWIDPIDSTSEYIQGRTGEDSGLVRTGLPCVTVLIGVFDRLTGAPLVGVVNQPFAEKDDGWTSKYFYGVNLQDLNVTHPPSFLPSNEKLVAVSSSEDADIKEILSDNGYTPVEIAGAGYKLLKIITGEVCAYVLSKPTTFLWDTCACNAILEAQGGGIINYSTLEPVRYRAGQGVKECCNDGGIIAYRNDEIINHLIQILNLVK
ncbi:hypothetical protein GE061_018081 [Apolygus lucorum]|uniref:Inositol polyphosphate 1-phosphatase n=1 Tax=Apolygus lucorum TaxID=248454 RepID=A0A8S9XGV9_APOLU|nr:hypothetical protein GE061_018081 [Apolygus lucorum]